MGFRISDASIFNTVVRNARLNRFALSEIQNQVSTGKRVNSVADDPSAASQILALKDSKARIDQLFRNIDSGRAQLDATESTLASVSAQLQRLRELAVSADQTREFAATKSEVEQIYQELVRLANTRSGDRYLFGGFNSDSDPFTLTGSFTDGVPAPPPTLTYNGDSGAVNIQIGEAASSLIQVNVTGREAFFGSIDADNTPDGSRVDIFATVAALRNALDDTVSGDPASVIDDLVTAVDQIAQIRGRLGARVNRLDQTESQLRAVEVAVETQRSSIEDLDLVVAITELQSREATYQATLGVTARIIRPSLLDFLG